MDGGKNTPSFQYKSFFVNLLECIATPVNMLGDNNVKGSGGAIFRNAYCAANEAKPFAETTPLLPKADPALHCL